MSNHLTRATSDFSVNKPNLLLIVPYVTGNDDWQNFSELFFSFNQILVRNLMIHNILIEL